MNQEKLEAMGVTFLLRNAHFVRQTSSPSGTRCANYCHWPGWNPSSAHLPSQEKAIVNVRNTDNRCFGYAIATALASALGDVEDHVARAVNYLHLFGKYGLDQLN